MRSDARPRPRAERALRRLLGPAVFHGRLKARRWRKKANDAVEDATVRIAPRLYREADRLSALPFRTARLPPADPEVLDDLAAYTGLALPVVQNLVQHRRPLDFRAEWHGTPPEMRVDEWFYLSSKTYLFGNAVHFAGKAQIEAIARLLPAGCSLLDFGAGTGNLAIALGRRGHTVKVDELNALQRDFIRFRIDRHDLGERVSLLDPWADPPADTVDAITAFDVFEHLAAGSALLDRRLLPVLHPGGILIENSPFVCNVANPMHHEDWGLDELLEARGLSLEHTSEDGTRVWRSGR